MTYGVIGLGGMGQHHARIYAELGILGAVFDIDKERTKKYSSLYDTYAADSLEDFLDQDLGGVSIVTPTWNHLDTIKKCLKAGLDILCEKPLAPSLEEAEEILELSHQYSDQILAVGYIEKYNPVFDAVKKLCRDDVLGDLISINIKRVGGIPRSADNVILDLMTHDFNLLLNLLERYPDKIISHTHNDSNILDAAQVLLSFGSTSATCEANWLTPIKIRNLQITGTKGYCEVDLINQKLTQFMPTKENYFKVGLGKNYILDIVSFGEEPLKKELLEFSLKNRSNLVLVEEGFNTLRLTMDALKF